MPQVIFDPRYVWTNPLAANPLAARSPPPARSPPDTFFVYRAEDNAARRRSTYRLRYTNPLFRFVSKFLDRAVTRPGVSMVFVPLKAKPCPGDDLGIPRDLAGRPLNWAWTGLDPLNPSAYCATCAFYRQARSGRGSLCLAGSHLMPGFRDWYATGAEPGWTLCRGAARGDGLHGVWRAIISHKVPKYTFEKSLAEQAGVVQEPYPQAPHLNPFSSVRSA